MALEKVVQILTTIVGTHTNPVVQFITKDPYYDVRAYDSINIAVSEIGSTEATLFISNTQTLTDNLTIPSTLTLKIVKGGSIVKALSFTLTINGSVEAGPYQIFSGFDAGDITGLSYALPEWWGIDGTDDQIEWEKAIYAMKILSGSSGYGLIEAGSSSYTISDSLCFNRTDMDLENLIIDFRGAKIITTSASTNYGMILGSIAGSYGSNKCIIKNFSLIDDYGKAAFLLTGQGNVARNLVENFIIRTSTVGLSGIHSKGDNSMGIFLDAWANGNYYNVFSKGNVMGFDKNISLGYNWNTGAASSHKPNANRFEHIINQYFKTYGVYDAVIGTYYDGDFDNATEVSATSITAAGGYTWTVSGGGDGSYYLKKDGGNPGIAEPSGIYILGNFWHKKPINSLANGVFHNWAWGDKDTLGYDTLYIRQTDSADPTGTIVSSRVGAFADYYLSALANNAYINTRNESGAGHTAYIVLGSNTNSIYQYYGLPNDLNSGGYSNLYTGQAGAGQNIHARTIMAQNFEATDQNQDVYFNSKAIFNKDTIRIATDKTPATATATGGKGDVCWDSAYIYVCIATNTWRRIAHNTW